MAGDYDIHVNAVAFTKAASDFHNECKFMFSIGSTSCYDSADFLPTVLLKIMTMVLT